jgi:hypothetical protein
MPMNRARRYVLAAGLALGALAAVPAPAAQKGQPEPQKLSNHQLHEAIHVLKSVKLTLEQADHDYGGHRAAAVRDVSAAEKQLKLALEHVHHTRKVGAHQPQPVTGKGNSEPQALSDAQLAQQVPVLKETIAFLQKADHDYGGHRARAIADLQAAIAQLEKALAYSKEKNANKP